VFASSTLATYSTGDARMESRPGSVCLRLAFPAGGGNVEELVRPEFRRTLAKAQRSADRTPGLAWEAVQSPDEAQRAHLADLNQQRFGARSFFASAANAAFFEALGRAEYGEAVSAVLSVYGTPRHIIYGYYHDDIFYYFLSGMTNAQGGPEAPGFANFSSLFASLMERGARRFDFLRGTERYKRDLGGSPVESFHRTLIPRAAELPYRLSRAAKGAKSVLQRFPARAEGQP
jgi:CelD/BcsL family acetyltransferase involved in cellulose biosynthesis